MIAHPCLFLSQDRIEIAKQSIAHQEWAQKTYHELKLDADRLAQMEMPEFETAWWQEAKKKRWQDVYPEVMQHTYYVPRGAPELAWRSAIVYQLGGGDIYAKRAKRVLLHYTSYPFEVEHPDVGMNYTGWGIRLLWTYDALYDYCTPEEREKLDDFFARLVNAVAKCDEFWIEHNPGGRYNNHYAWHKMMMAAYGLFYGDDKWVERAMGSDQGIRDLIEKGLLDDGIWFESSLNYHFAALWALYTTADMFRAAGHPLDLYTHRFARGRTLEDGFSGILQVAFPDTTLPTIGDAYGHVAPLADNPAYDYAWIAYHRPIYAWLLSQKKGRRDVIRLFDRGPASADDVDVSPPAVRSRTFPEHGHAILRSVEGREYWDSDSWAAFMSYDVDSVHSHRDKLDFILFGRGKLLAPDPEAISSAQHAFSSQVQRELNRTTLCHNTLMVDSKDHRGIGERLSLIEFRRTKDAKTATAADLKGLVYPGVRLQRTIALTDEYVLDVFQAVSESEHTFDWLLHAKDDEGKTVVAERGRMGEWENGGKEEWRKGRAGEWEKGPWSWLRNPRTAGIDGTWQAEWRQGDVRFRLTMLGVPGTEVTLCDFPKNDKFEPPPIPMLIVRRTGKSAVFLALYQAEKSDLPDAQLALDTEGTDLAVKVTLGDTSRRHKVKSLR